MIDKLEPPPRLDEYVSRLTVNKIGQIEMFRYDRSFVAETMYPIGTDEVFVLLQMTCGGVSGRAELHLPGVHPNFDLVRFASVYKSLKKGGIPEALRQVKASKDDWGLARRRLAEAALNDLAGKLQNPELAKAGNPSGFERSLLFDCSQAYYSF